MASTQSLLCRMRRALAPDLVSIVRLIHAGSHQPGQHGAHEVLAPAHTDAFARMSANPRCWLMVAEVDRAVVGTLQLDILDHLSYGGGLAAQVESVHVDPAWRGRGCGGAMMAWTIAEARRQGCHRVQLTSNRVRETAHRFYTRLGFVDSHVGFKLVL